MSTQRERAEEKRKEKLKAVEEQVAEGSLTIRQMTPEEKAKYPKRDRPPQPKRGTPAAFTKLEPSQEIAGGSGTVSFETMFVVSSGEMKAQWRGSRTGCSAVHRFTDTRNARPR